MSHDDLFIHLGQREGWGGSTPFGFTLRDRRQHVYLIGKTGTGKSTLIKQMLVQDLHAGRGVGLIDPHGDLAQELLEYVPPWRTDDLVYFNPADAEYPIGLNLLQQVPPDARHVVASGIVSAFKSIWRDSWGPRLEYILYAAVAALLDCQNVTLLGLPRMLSDERYRHWVIKQCQDPLVRAFWQREFAQYDPRFLQEAIAPIQNKVGRLLLSAPIRNVLGQVQRKVDARFMMDHRRILIANLSKGMLGEDTANLLGALLVTSFQLAAMSRASIPEQNRQDYCLYIDEFQNFTTDAFASILSEARKYRLNLVLAHQYMGQLQERVRDAVLGNCGTLLSFRIGQTDAEHLAQEYGSGYSASWFTELANYHVAVKLLLEGEHPEPFRAVTLPLEAHCYRKRDTLIRRSREKYATPRSTVEERITRWMDFR